MKHLLDTNTCVGWLRLSQPKIIDRIKRHAPTDLVICSVVVAELIDGAERAAPHHQAQNRFRVELLRQQFVSLPFDDSAAECYGKTRAYLAKRGTLIGPNDLMIAAICLSHGLTLVTHNTSEFNRVPGLVIDDWQ